MATERKRPRAEINAAEQWIKVRCSARAWDQVVKYAELHGVSTEDVCDNVVIDAMPLPKHPARCGLCNRHGHRAKACPDQVKMPWHPKAAKA